MNNYRKLVQGNFQGTPTSKKSKSNFLLQVSSMFALAAFAGQGFAQSITYDGTALGSAQLEPASHVGDGLPLWMGLSAGAQGVIYRDTGGATLIQGADLVIDYGASGDDPQFVIGGYWGDLTLNQAPAREVLLQGNDIAIYRGHIQGSIYGAVSHKTVIRSDSNTSGQPSLSAAASAAIEGFKSRIEASHVTVGEGVSVADSVYGANATVYLSAGGARTGNVVTQSFQELNTSVNAYGVAEANYSRLYAQRNSVRVDDNVAVSGDLHGGHAEFYLRSGQVVAGNVQANLASDEANASAISASAYGSVSAILSELKADNNQVFVGRDSFVAGDVHGGYASIDAQAGRAEGGNIQLGGNHAPGNKMAYAYAYVHVTSVNLSAIQNTVSINARSIVQGSVYGGYSALYAQGGTAIGGQTDTNSTDIFAKADVNAANAQVRANENQVEFNGELRGGSIYGGYAYFYLEPGVAQVSGDHVRADADVQMSGSQAYAINNMVSIGADARMTGSDASLYGGYLAYNTTGDYRPELYDVFTGNTLNYAARQPLVINTVANFENYNFTLEPSLVNSTTALITAQTVIFGASTDNMSSPGGQASEVKVVAIHSGETLNVGDKFVLIRATGEMSGYGVGAVTTAVAQQGISLLYDVQTSVDATSRLVSAEILACEMGVGGACPVVERPTNPDFPEDPPAARVNPQLKALSEGYLAGAMLVTRGADMVANDVLHGIQAQGGGQGYVPFVLLSGSHTRYNSGSHIDANGYLLSVGMGYRHHDLTAGLFAETGWGSYDSYNSFYNAVDVHGKGNNRYYGVGVIGRYQLTERFYTDASMRFGQTKTSFDTHDIQNLASGQYASYDMSSRYFSAHVGAGYEVPLSQKSVLELTANYLFTRVEGKTAVVAGDFIRFNHIDSHRLRVNAQVVHCYSEAVTLNAGLGYEHEFDGQARATAYGHYEITAPSVTGGTGMVTVGARVSPSGYKHLELDVTANGYMGQREGVGISAFLRYAF